MLNGIIPFLPPDYLDQKLQPHQRTLLDMLLKREVDPADVADDTDQMLDALELTGVWGKRDSGIAYVRAFLVDEERMFVHTKVFDASWPEIPAEVRSRKFTVVRSFDELLIKVMAEAHSIKTLTDADPEVLAEDHPEMDSVGWRIVQTNQVWLMRRSSAITTKSSAHPDAVQMFQTGIGRTTLAKVLAKGTLRNIHTMTPTMQAVGGAVGREVARADERFRINLASKSVADAFMKRKGGKP